MTGHAASATGGDVGVGSDRVDLSVVVPCRNHAARLPELLDVLAAERPGVPWELVVADNGSTDGTRVVTERRAGDLPTRVVEAGDRRGAWHARNVGAAAALGDHLLFLAAIEGRLAVPRADGHGDARTPMPSAVPHGISLPERWVCLLGGIVPTPC